MDLSTHDLGILIIVVIIGYFFPFYIALIRNHYRKVLIFLLNLIFGWSGIGWIALLIYSIASKPRKSYEEIRSEYT
jgi:Superinfection immunity protein